MTTLSSLIVARRAASIAQVDEALARQVVRGGDLGTCLLELEVVTEEDLVALLAEAHGFSEAAAGELPMASASVLRLVPRAVALRYGIYPLEEREGELYVAVSEPLPQAVEDDLGFALGAHLRQHAAPMVRIRQAIARDYGLPLDRRFLRLLAKLEKKPDPSPSDPPPREKTPPFPGTGAVRLSKFGTMIVDSAVPPPPPVYTDEPPSNPSPAHRIVAPAPRRNTWPGMVAAPPERPAEEPDFRRPTQTIASDLPIEEPALESNAPAPRMSTPPPAPPPSAAPPEAPAPPPEKRSNAPPPGFVMEASAATAAQVERKRRRRAEHAPGKALLGWARRALGNTIPSDRAPERRRGPLTAAEAELQLEGATTGEQALTVFFAFARQYFHYSALFMVHGDLAAGYDAWGAGATREKVRTIGVALDLPSALSFAKGRATPTLMQLKRVGLDADLRADLSRPAPQEVLILPIVMRQRCVALLYADDGDQSVDFGEIGDVVGMGSLLAATLERILIRKKRAALRDPSAVKNKRDEDFDRSRLSPSDPARAAVSSPPEVSDLAVKRGVWSEEEIVDEGWTLPGDLDAPDLTPRSATPVEGKRSVPPNEATPAGARKPITRDPDDSPPELLISEAEDASSMSELLEEIGDQPSPSPLNALRSLSLPELVRRAVDPMASTSISAGPHPPPPASQGPFRNLPSVLIRSDLVDQVIAGGEKADRALGEILTLGEAAIPSVFARFPGPLTVDRNQALGELPRPADCGPVLRIVAAMRRLALPFLAVRSADADVEVRFWSTYLLGELNYADSGTALLPRLFDENPTVRRIALRSARSIVGSGGDEGNPIRKSLERMVISTDEPFQRRLTALATISELKLHRAIPSLIEVLDDDSDALVDGAARALAAMTRQEFGRDRRRWNEWWESKGKKRLG